MAAGDARVEVVVQATDLFTAVLKRFGNEADRQGKKAKKGIRKAGEGADDARRKVSNLDRSLGKLGSRLAATAAGFVSVAAAAASIRKGTQAYLDFNRAITEVSTIYDDTIKSIGQVSEEVRDLALALGENEAVVARGFYQTISAGVTDAADATIVLSEATKLAIAGLSDTATTVDAITTVLNAYGTSASEASRVSDVLFKSVELGKTRVEELASSIGNVVPISAQLNVSFEETAAAIVQLTKSGVSTAEAVTRVRSALVALLKRGDDINKLFQERLGKSFSATDIKANGLISTLLDLREATRGNESELVRYLGRVEAVAGTLGVTQNEARGTIEVFKQLQAATGATGRALDKQLESPARRLQIVLGGVRQGLLGLGESFVAGVLEDLEEGFGSAEEAAKAAKDTVAAFAPAAELAGKGVLGLASTFVILNEALGSLNAARKELMGLIGDLSEVEEIQIEVDKAEITKNLAKINSLILGTDSAGRAADEASKRYELWLGNLRQAQLAEQTQKIRDIGTAFEETIGSLDRAKNVDLDAIGSRGGRALEELGVSLVGVVDRAEEARRAINSISGEIRTLVLDQGGRPDIDFLEGLFPTELLRQIKKDFRDEVQDAELLLPFEAYLASIGALGPAIEGEIEDRRAPRGPQASRGLRGSSGGALPWRRQRLQEDRRGGRRRPQQRGPRRCRGPPRDLTERRRDQEEPPGPGCRPRRGRRIFPRGGARSAGARGRQTPGAGRHPRPRGPGHG
jgi:TP901 family phage tail tape measure protein